MAAEISAVNSSRYASYIRRRGGGSGEEQEDGGRLVSAVGNLS